MKNFDENDNFDEEKLSEKDKAAKLLYDLAKTSKKADRSKKMAVVFKTIASLGFAAGLSLDIVSVLHSNRPVHIAAIACLGGAALCAVAKAACQIVNAVEEEKLGYTINEVKDLPFVQNKIKDGNDLEVSIDYSDVNNPKIVDDEEEKEENSLSEIFPDF